MARPDGPAAMRAWPHCFTGAALPSQHAPPLRAPRPAPSQIHGWTAKRNARPRLCPCSSAAGLTRRRVSPPQHSPPLYCVQLAAQATRVRLEPAGVEAYEVPGTHGAVWMDMNGVARCRHGFSRSALERGGGRAADGTLWRCSCSTRGMRRSALYTACRRRRRREGAEQSAVADESQSRPTSPLCPSVVALMAPPPSPRLRDFE